MTAGSLARRAFGAALLVNAVPHGVAALQGRPFPSPFASPPGVGLSAPPANVMWSAINLLLAALVLRRPAASAAEHAAGAAGALAMALYLARRFGRLGIR